MPRFFHDDFPKPAGETATGSHEDGASASSVPRTEVRVRHDALPGQPSFPWHPDWQMKTPETLQYPSCRFEIFIGNSKIYPTNKHNSTLLPTLLDAPCMVKWFFVNKSRFFQWSQRLREANKSRNTNKFSNKLTTYRAYWMRNMIQIHVFIQNQTLCTCTSTDTTQKRFALYRG